jgi:hypothetical protein
MTLQAWLDSERDYEVGRLLYEHYGDNARLKQVLGHGPSAYNCEALAWELQKLAKQVHDAGPPYQIGYIGNTLGFVGLNQPIRATEENATETLQTEPAKDFSADIDQAALLIPLSQARRPLYDERTLLHGQLEVLAEKGTQEEVRQAAERVMQLSRELNANWKIDAYVREHGQLPPAPAPKPGLEALTPAELVTKRNTLRSRVSKLKKQSHRADDLATVQAELLQVETLLNPEK